MVHEDEVCVSKFPSLIFVLKAIFFGNPSVGHIYPIYESREKYHPIGLPGTFPSLNDSTKMP